MYVQINSCIGKTKYDYTGRRDMNEPVYNAIWNLKSFAIKQFIKWIVAKHYNILAF